MKRHFKILKLIKNGSIREDHLRTARKYKKIQ